MMTQIKKIGFLKFKERVSVRKIVSFVLLITLFLLRPKRALANDNYQFVTIVNPVRISTYTKSSRESLISEYQVVNSLDLQATWLITYDVLERPDLVSVLKNMNSDQELGIFLEVTDSFTQEAGVKYNDTGFWHHANSLFLSGYQQEERIKLIDKVFETFKEKIGYYPTSIGSWWTDSFSLSYMQEKYGVTANLGCSDQFSTDGYEIWGQPFSIPFYPSKYHSGIPASDEDNSVGIVNLLWAPRDPLNGYYNSLFSTQDYLVVGKNLDINFFKDLINIYAFKNQNSFGQITVGLEADVDPEVYKKEYFKQLTYIKELLQKGEVQVLNMSRFSDWYRDTFKDQFPSNLIQTEDLLDTDKSVTWFQNSKYRFSYEENDDGKIEVRDFRIYDENFIEPYYVSPNRDFNLRIDIPFIIDKISDPEHVWILEKGSSISFQQNEITIKTESKIPDFIKKNRYIDISKIKGGIKIGFEDFNYFREGKVVKDFSIETKHILKSPKILFRHLLKRDFNIFQKTEYFIPQEEIIALNFLYTQPKGKVLVFDNECLQCSYSTKLKPLFFSNSRKYVQQMSDKKIVYDSSIFESLAREEAKKKIKSLGVKYIYLVRFEDYKEEVPYSPGDLGIEKIFENANAQIWIVK